MTLLLLNGGEKLVLLVLVCLIGYVAYLFMKKGIRKGDDFTGDMDDAERFRAYKNHIYPLAIFAHSLQDDTLLERKNEERENLRRNKNPFDDLVPICVFYPRTVFSMTIGKELITADFTGMSYATYIATASETYAKISRAWLAELQKNDIANEDQIAQLILNQKFGKPKIYK